MVHIDIM